MNESALLLKGRRVLVTGATGAVGPAVINACLAAGAVVRTMQRTAATTPRVESTVGDLTRPDTLSRALEGIDTVVHLAGLLHVNNPPPAMLADYQRVNVEATQNLLHACAVAQVRRVVFASTVAVYGPTSPGAPPTTEMAGCAPDTPYGRSKLAAERHVLACGGSGRLPEGVVLRCAAVYGVQVKGNYQRLVRAVARGRFVTIGHGNNRRTLVHEDDLSKAFVLATAHPAAVGRTFNITDGRVHRVRDIVSAIAAATGGQVHRIQVPALLAFAGATLIEGGAALLRRQPPVHRGLVRKLLEDVAVDGSLASRVLGFVPQFDLESGWRDVIGRMRNDGRLPPVSSGR